jgi:Ca2+-binding RTX toxin-like protein
MNGLRGGADVYGASAADTLRGTPYTDILQGGRGPDRMFGGAGKDYIDGMDGIAGNDTSTVAWEPIIVWVIRAIHSRVVRATW